MKKIDRTNEEFIHPIYGKYKILNYINARNCEIIFEDGSTVKNLKYSDVKNNSVKNPYYPVVYDVGYVGQGLYSTRKNNIKTKAYTTWSGVFRRTHDKKWQERQPSYKGCTIDPHWHNFQNFAEWYEDNYISKTMQGWQLDKDILVKGNKIYSAEMCCFVPQEINALFTNRQNNRGNYPIGVSKSGKKFQSEINCGKGRKFLGTFDTPEEAFQAYKEAKESYIKEIADKWKDQITEQTYTAMYNYVVEITD